MIFIKNTYFEIKSVAKSFVKKLKLQSLVNEIASYGLTMHLQLYRVCVFVAKLHLEW